MNTMEHNGESFSQVAGASAYYISPAGKVFSAHAARILKPARTNTPTGRPGYLQCWLVCDNGEKRWQKIHRLVALAFVPNPEQKSSVNHKDGDKLNNTPENLEWMTHRENIHHAHALGLCPPKRGSEHYNFGKAMSEATKEKCRRAKDGVRTPKPSYITPRGTFTSPTKAAQVHGTDWQTITNYCKRGKDGWSYLPAST